MKCFFTSSLDIILKMKSFAHIVSISIFVFTMLTPAGSSNAEWILVRYKDLVNPEQIVRTGERIGTYLSSQTLANSSKALLQPHLDPFIDLLPDALDMVSAPSMTPFRDVSAFYPRELSEPAWVELFRDGRFLALYDGAGTVRLFLPGTSPRRAYQNNYGVVRHCLASISKTAGKINVEVYSYQHDYSKTELKLYPLPYRFSSDAFPIPQNKIPLNLTELFAFFRAGKPLAGANVNEKGLTLLAAEGETPKVDGVPITLSDFAVAYRSIFHAGQNSAFISLDPNASPTLATVNFGGYLENTAVGRTVLSADKRFKTIAAGLDPNTFTDRSNEIRQAVPNFLSAVERDLLGYSNVNGKWIGTRFWFYPESVEIETNENFSAARLIRARFTADAERQRDDFKSSDDFERFKQTMLSPSIRECIANLNSNYDLYSKVFPEFKELDHVARLLGICSWLKRRPAQVLDLDALLSVEVPVKKTPKTKTQMIAAAWLVSKNNSRPDQAAVISNRSIQYLSTYLDLSIEEVFGTADVLTKFLELVAKERGEENISVPNLNWDFVKSKKVREILTTRAHLLAFTKFLASVTNPLKNLPQEEGTFYSMNVLSIGGGINLGSDEFTIRVRRNRGSIRRNRRSAPIAKPPEFLRLPVVSLPSVTEFIRPIPAPELRRTSEYSNSKRSNYSSVDATGNVKTENYWFLRKNNSDWRDRLITTRAVRERHYEGGGMVIHEENPEGATSIIGVKQGNVIVFKRQESDVKVSNEVPEWWKE